MKIHLTKKESETFFDVLDNESICVVNEYDPDTGRRPSKKRMSAKEILESVIHKWEATQGFVPGTQFVNLDETKACELELNDKETKYVRELLTNTAHKLREELSNYPKPYEGVLECLDEAATRAEGVAVRLSA